MKLIRFYAYSSGVALPLAAFVVFLVSQKKFDLESWRKGSEEHRKEVIPNFCTNFPIRLLVGNNKFDIVAELGKPDIESESNFTYGSYPAITFEINTEGIVTNASCAW